MLTQYEWTEIMNAEIKHVYFTNSMLQVLILKFEMDGR